MFWCKQVDPFENKVKCEECKLYTDKSDAQKITKRAKYFLDVTKVYIYYCKNHKVPYDEIIVNPAWGMSPVLFFKSMEVDMNGTPVGYKKLKV